MTERMTDSGQCIECRRELDRFHYKKRYENKIKPRICNPEHRKKAAEKQALYRTAWTEEKIVAHREAAKLRSREWRKKNRAHRNALKGKYLADKLKRTPLWADHSKIIEIYKNCPKGYHVDHIIPLRAKNVSGLHVQYNLQYLPAIENMRKNNRYVSQ